VISEQTRAVTIKYKLTLSETLHYYPHILVMQPGQMSPSDEKIWKMACNNPFMPPPQQWTFENQGVKFGCDIYHVDQATLYELALLEVHSQYWETTSPEHLRRYHRGLQYNVEYSFRSASATSLYHTPSFLRPWLLRVIFLKPHDIKGRRMVDYILDDVSKDERLKLETGNFQEDGVIHFLPIIILTCA
jgi:hypothetical protein